ncbi:MAG TPA: hypothetical protein VFN67_42670 [Polyangiales bacterium]|nr:hypothetical protein [Polyangiales bacterium]
MRYVAVVSVRWQASVQVPGGIEAAILYDFCLNALTEAAVPATPPPAPFQAGANQN